MYTCYVIKTQLHLLISNHFKKLLWAPSIICCWIDPNNTMHCLIQIYGTIYASYLGYYYTYYKCTLHVHRTVPYYVSLCAVFAGLLLSCCFISISSWSESALSCYTKKLLFPIHFYFFTTLSVKWNSFYVLYSGGYKCNSPWLASLRSGRHADIQ
jgi:hypothetical protein